MIFLISCGSKNQQSEYEAWNSGELTVYYDNTLTPMIDTVFKLYQRAFPDIKSNFVSVSSREGMALLLNGKAKVLLQSRNYLKDEDSLKNAFNVQLPDPWEMAEDALIFFVNKNVPIDTLNVSNLCKYLIDYKTQSQFGLNLNYNPEFVLPELNTSVYANFKEMVLKDSKTQRIIKTFSSLDSVKDYVESHPNAIGIAYLSHILGDLRFKPIPLGYLNEKGEYVNPKPVHQAYIVQGLYPFIIKHRIFLQQEKKDIALWFATFISKESYIQKYFKDFGIVPSYAKIVLIKEE
ncbi:MAG: hypothetical protein A2X64_02515 [Ignavibacteria bacterium GWF2_33_9]|nr:MAG: hypothetical protein A2X64_02515 [Ignavibacteria bacterium GWF2_33_9]